MTTADEKNVKGIAVYEKDSMRYHRFKVKSEKGVKGSIYVPKDLPALPARIILDLTTE